MPETEPVRIPYGLHLPPAWQLTEPPEGGQIVMAAVRPVPDHPGFLPNVTAGITGVTGSIDLLALADRAAGRLAETATDLTIMARTEVGSPEAPGITQVLRVRGLQGDLEVIQSQVMLVLGALESMGQHVVLELVCTCTDAQTQTVIPEFEQIVASVHVDEPTT